MAEKAGDAVPAAQRSSWTSFMKSIASVSGDLSSMTAPPFILSPVSLTEYPAYWCERPDLFAAIADAKDGEARALAILKWFISTLKDQYTTRNETTGSEKKPLNPVLGELFYGIWPDKNGRGQTSLLVEQVSHHPPVTAYVIENKTKGLKLVGHNGQKTSFSGGSIIVKQVGHATLSVTPPGGSKTDYLITFPRLRIDGLWYGSPYIELTETTTIAGPDFTSTVEYKGKGYFSGKSHSFKASVTPAQVGNGVMAPKHTIEGTWHTTSKYTSGSKGAFHDVTGAKETVTAIGALEGGAKMGEWETRELWREVAKGIVGGDFESASREKTRIEVAQRERRKEEKEKGETWALKHFDLVSDDADYEKLRVLVKVDQPDKEAYLFKENWPETNKP